MNKIHDSGKFVAALPGSDYRMAFLDGDEIYDTVPVLGFLVYMGRTEENYHVARHEILPVYEGGVVDPHSGHCLLIRPDGKVYDPTDPNTYPSIEDWETERKRIKDELATRRSPAQT
jgi:hypothetical protein